MSQPDTDNAADLVLLVQSHHALVAMETAEEQRAEELVRAACDEVGLPLYGWSLTRGLASSDPPTMYEGTESPDKALAWIDQVRHEAVFLLKDVASSLGKPTIVRRLRDLAYKFVNSRSTVVLLGPTVTVPPELTHLTVPFRLALPGPEALETLVGQVFRDLRKHLNVRCEMTRRDMDHLVQNMRGLTHIEAKQAVTQAVVRDRLLNSDDVAEVLETKRRLLSREGVVEYVTVAEGTADVGGMANLRRWLHRREGALSDKAREFGLPMPGGMLLLGVQGCGKSLCCKAVARTWGLPLLRLDPGKLYDRFVGESEKNLRRMIEVAEAMAPCVLWIDEIEKALASAAGAEADGGLSRRMFGTMLTWLQDKTAPVFVVATANDIAALPPELLRKGRFDEIFFVDLPTPAERRQIFDIHLRRRSRDPGQFDMDALVAASDGFSGAEIEQAVVGGLYAAFGARGKLDTPTLLAELKATYPLSVTMAEKIAELREWARGRCVSASG